ncbi:hypothetical protein Tco_0912915 [Tanacetum coccineum]
MLVDALRQHKVEGQVNRTVEKVRGLKIKQEVAEVAKEVVEVAKKVIRVVKEVVEVMERMKMVVECLNLLLSSLSSGCSYKEFMACNPKDYDGKGGVIVYTRWIEKMESVQDMSGCGENQKVKYIAGSFIDLKVFLREEFCPNNEIQKLETEFWCHAMVGAGHAAYTDQFHELATLVPHLITPKNKRIERMLTDEAIRNEALKKNTEKRGNDREPSRDGNVKDDNKRVGPRIVNPLNARNSIAARGAYFECGGTDHYKAACPRLN